MKESPTSRDPNPREGSDSLPADGVDVTLIRWLLSLSPTERLDVLQGMVDSLELLRGGRATA